MRSARFALAFCILVLAIPSWGKQASQQTSAPQPTSDPRAVAVLQAAITALGGATAIAQAQSWTVQGLLDGPIGNGTSSETISWNMPNLVMQDGTIARARRPMIPSAFLPVLVSAMLVRESQDPNYTMRYGGSITSGTKAVALITFSLARTPFATAQNWYFDTVTGLPSLVEFKLPMQAGLMKSPSCTVVFSDFRSVAGALYPFRIQISVPDWPLPEMISVQSVNPTAAILPIAATMLAGGAQ